MNLANRLGLITAKKEKKIIGLMSGMSMDGINLAHINVSGDYPKLKIELISSCNRAYSKTIRDRLLSGRSASVSEVAALNVAVAEEFANAVLEYLKNNNLTSSEIDLIGSHGQTLYHSSLSKGEHTTLQVGDPSIIAERTGIPTIGNFRLRDMAVGGQGAPLVPLADYILFHEVGKVIAVNNLGSISNVTVVTPEIENLLAFDTGPANMAIDYIAALVPDNISGIDYNGEVSAKGKPLPILLNELLDLPYFKKAPPKAAGYDDFGPNLLKEIAKRYSKENLNDLVRTAVELSAITISDAYKKFVIPKFSSLSEIRFSGGGIYNQTLMNRIRDLLPELKVETFSPEFSDAKEAISFAVLAHETLHGRPGNVLGATGATKRVVLGEIAV